jgi:hypothetical protein
MQLQQQAAANSRQAGRHEGRQHEHACSTGTQAEYSDEGCGSSPAEDKAEVRPGKGAREGSGGRRE